MERYATLLLGVWREACRNIELAESVQCIAPLIAKRLPADLVLVRRVHLAESAVETIAIGAKDEAAAADAHARTVVKEQDLKRLLAWSKRGEVSHLRTRAAHEHLPGAIPLGISGDALVGPLNVDDGPAGFLVLVAESPRAFDAEDLATCVSLLEPFSVALQNDARVREMRSLRDVAEADRQSLLTRLGRSEISEAVIGAEAGLREVMERVDQVAASDVPVLILGDTGSGKEVVARAIHARSRRGRQSFVRVNCGAIPPELIDSELFGHERGSFTGAVSSRQGWFERADGGTLFLDEIAELTPPAQVRLLRVLQDGTYERVGGSRSMHSDVRIIAATHRDLPSMVSDGRFRQDLWYRVAVFPIRLPSLRERAHDIPALATHFAVKAARRFGVSPLALSRDDLSLLVSYPWPGNVRELAAVMDRAVILGDGRSLAVAKALGAMPPAITGTEGGDRAHARDRDHDRRAESVAPARAAPGTVESAPTLDQAMVEHIEAALRAVHGRIEGPFGAAARLGVNAHTLRSRMEKLKIDWRAFRQRSGKH